MSTLHVENLKGLSSGGNANKIIVPSGQTLHAPGHVIQVVDKTFTTQTASTSQTYIDVNGGSLSITPKFSNSKIFVNFNFSLGFNSSTTYMYGGTQVLRGSTVLTTSPTDGTGSYEVGTAIGSSSTIEVYHRYSHQLIDSPSTTSAVTYKLQLKAYGTGGGTMRVNPGGNAIGTSHIILQEIAQ